MARNDLIEKMAFDLCQLKVDLGDEREVIRGLSSLRYLSGDIVACMDEAIERAREIGPAPSNLTSIIGDGAAAVFGLGVWVAWYAVLCPSVPT